MWRPTMRERPRAADDGRIHEFAFAQRQRLAAHDACHGEPAESADRDQDRQRAAAEHDRQDDHEEDLGQRVQHVYEAHHQRVGAPAPVTRERAPGDADDERDERRRQRDRERDAKPMQRAHQEVAAEPVGAEPVSRGLEGRHRHVCPVDLVLPIVEQRGTAIAASARMPAARRAALPAGRGASAQRLAPQAAAHSCRSRRMRGSSEA